MVSTGARILIALEIFGGAGRSLLRVVEARELTAVQVLTDDALEATEVTQVFAGDEGDSSTRGERAARTANAVHVVFNLVREVEVHDVTDAVNVDAARSNVGRNENADFTILESLQCTLALGLRAVGVDGGTRDTVAVEFAADAVSAVLSAGEDEDHVHGFVLQEVVQHNLLEGARALKEQLSNGLGRVGAAADFNELRRALILLGQGLDLAGERGREHQGLTFRWECADDCVDRWEEAHVEHSVSFVEDEALHGGEVTVALAAQVEQTAGGRDKEVAALTEGGDLGAFANAAVAGGDDCARIAGVGGHVFGDLDD